MLFVIICKDAKNSSETRPIYRKEHLARLEKLDKEGKLILAGPFTDMSGSLIIIDAENIESAQKFAENDPFYLNGVYTSFDIKPFKQVYPNN
ncbi:MAG: YciI family protein [Spirochaetota bacterium]|nr:YciI family protein [Spirochaetota bacterium]